MSLPTLQDTIPRQPSAVGTSYGIVSRLIVSSSDVIDHNFRLKISDERSKKVEWTQERTLTEAEVIDSLVESSNGRTAWTVHRPIQGWYIKLRSPAFPENFFIPLTPYSTKAHSAHFSGETVVDGSFTFACRTVALDISRPSAPSTPARSSFAAAGAHSYPPSPGGPNPTPSPRDSIGSTSTTATLVEENKNRALQVNEATTPTSSSSQQTPLNRRPPPPPLRAPPQSQVTHFLITPEPLLAYPLSPEQEMRQQQQGKASHRVTGLFSSLTQKIVGTTKRSFTIKIPSSPYPTSAYGVNQTATDSSSPMLTLITFHDTTPTFSLGSHTSGVIELDDGIARILGVDKGFYIAVTLAFLQFLEDKQAYVAASDG
ncbi:hypothetical protein FRB97_007000 [Tulasnella sp. 331]|nr:hypothetical protein FRB97_007000 [Tulasnella sp. 331]